MITTSNVSNPSIIKFPIYLAIKDYVNQIENYNQLFIFTILMLVIPNTSQAEVEDHQKKQYSSAGSCASSNCHGDIKANKSYNILGNEYTIWKKRDSHSKAWETLTNAESKKIGINLGIKDPSTEQQCLSCHSNQARSSDQVQENNVSSPADTEGVSCESCHGDSKNWIKSHTVKDTSHKENLNNGMNDLVSPVERSKTCLNCHLGDPKNEVTHQLISAGHPRLTFELDTFTQIMPPHWKIDSDYIKRKGNVEPIQYWLAGQVERSIKFLTNFENSLNTSRQPDFAFSNCYNCHHSLVDNQWKKRDYHGKTGILKLNLSSVLLTKIVIKELDISTYHDLESLVLQLQDVVYTEIKSNDVERLIKFLELEVKPKITESNFNHAKLIKLRKGIISFGKDQKYPTYEIAEQLIMALSSIADSLGENAVSKYKKFYDILEDEESFNEETFAQKFEKL